MTSALKASGGTRQWRRIRAAILLRDNYRCRYCSGPANSVDHVVSRHDGGTDHPDNLVAACMPCNLDRRAPQHKRPHRKTTGAPRTGRRRTSGVLD